MIKIPNWQQCKNVGETITRQKFTAQVNDFHAWFTLFATSTLGSRGTLRIEKPSYHSPNSSKVHIPFSFNDTNYVLIIQGNGLAIDTPTTPVYPGYIGKRWFKKLFKQYFEKILEKK